MAVARVCDYDCAMADMRPASDSCFESPQSNMHTAEPDPLRQNDLSDVNPAAAPMPSVSSRNLLSDGTLCEFGDCSACCGEFGFDCITFNTPDESGFESIVPQYITLGELTQVSSEPAEVDISARLISVLPAEVGIPTGLISALPTEVDISAKLIWSLPANIPAAKVDITTTTCKRVLTNRTTEFVAATAAGFCLGADGEWIGAPMCV